MAGRVFLMISLVCLVFSSCSRKASKKTMLPADRLVIADDLRARGKCSRAILEYEQLLSEFPTQEIAERAEFSLAQCRMMTGEYDLAIQGFEDFIDSYPRSELIDNAIYLIAISYTEQSPRPQRDQTKTAKALDELYLLLREYPDSDVRAEAEERIAECRSRLAEKDYRSGELYLKLRHNQAARVYFDSVISDYGDTSWYVWAVLGKGLAFEQDEEFSRAAEIYQSVIKDHPATEASAEATRRLEELGGVLNREMRTTSQR
jgi:outer membrane protein assembly factor BamD